MTPNSQAKFSTSLKLEKLREVEKAFSQEKSKWMREKDHLEQMLQKKEEELKQWEEKLQEEKEEILREREELRHLFGGLENQGISINKILKQPDNSPISESKFYKLDC